ncbi:MAG: hypothetical protein AAF743_00910, partial [Planctomycetota bacterium]
VVIGIIALLVGILVPTVTRIRISSQAAATGSLIQQIAGAAEAYAVDLGGYPGPYRNSQLGPGGSATFTVTTGVNAAGFSDDPFVANSPSGTGKNAGDIGVTGAENLVLGLLGGLTGTGGEYNPTTVGQGPLELRGAVTSKRLSAFFSPQPNDLSWRETEDGRTGDFFDESGDPNDTIIPEFVDRFADPMPILYLRASRGAAGVAPDFPNTDDGGQYGLNQIIAYTGPDIDMLSVGIGKDTDISETHGLNAIGAGVLPDGEGPFDFGPYLQNPEVAGQPRQKDGFILISAGRDRIYGTRDDITNFGGI